MTQALYGFRGQLAPQFQHDGTIHDGFRQMSYAGDGLRAPCRKLARFVVVAYCTNDVGRLPRVPGINDPAQLLVFLEKRIRLVNQQCRVVRLDDTKHGGRRNI